MITLWVGQLGSGKTYCAVHRAIRILDRGSWLVTNIELIKEEVEKFLGHVLDWSRYIYMGVNEKSEYQVVTLAEWCPHGTERDPVTVIIDECSEWLDAYFEGSKLLRLLSWFRMSRHLGIDIQLVTQDENLVQRRLRLLCGQIWRHSDGKKIRIPHLGIPLPPPWRWCFATVGFDRTGKLPLTGIYWESRSAAIWACYHTVQMYQQFGGQVVKSISIGIKKMTFREQFLLWSNTIAICALCFFGWRYYSKPLVLSDEVQKSIVKNIQGSVVSEVFSNSMAGVVSNMYKPIIEVSSWAYIHNQNHKLLNVDGEFLSVGRWCKHGKVLLIGLDKVLCRDIKDRFVMLVRKIGEGVNL